MSQPHGKPYNTPPPPKPMPKWVAYWKLPFEIRVKEGGLAIHGSGGGLEIGSIVEPNLQVLRDLEGYPYVPGSSIKGKLRSTLEKILGKQGNRSGEPCGCGECTVCKLFGPHMWTKRYPPPCAPTRLVVRDAPLSAPSKAIWTQRKAEGKEVLETKTENIINRLTGAAEHPRAGERVPAGTAFSGEIILHVYGDDDAAMHRKTLTELMKVIGDASGIGSSVTRGSGMVELTPAAAVEYKLNQFS
jgi:CRISPR-associated protein Csm3